MKIEKFLPPTRTLLGPGPSDVAPSVLEAMSRPLVGHLDPSFISLMEEIKTMLRAVMLTENEMTFPVSGTGSAGMEFCFVNLIEPGDEVIVGINGVFGKNFQTTGLQKKEAEDLAKLLKSGSLAAPMDFVEERVVGPSLGAENVKNGMRAVVFAFLFTLVFFSIYYRMFGVITSAAMLFNLLIVVAVMSLFGATMTLPGFAGLALSVGLSVDANVLINERIREELRAGVPGKTAIVTGYERASGTILDANLTGLIVGVALFAFGTGPLKGFALTMIIGIFASMFTAITVSRALATLIYGRRKKLQNVAI